MTEFDAILEDIRANPADDLPRLALADWLMEQDDPAARSRGEFIHARCRAAVLPPRDPERAALQRRAEELRERHEIEWLGGLGAYLDSWDFERGMIVAGIASLSGGRSALNLLASCPGWKWVIGIRGSASKSLALGRLIRSPHLATVSTLDLRDCWIGQSARAIARSPHLSRLVSLDLGYARLGTEGLQGFLEGHRLPALRTLLLDNNGITFVAIQALAASPNLPRLERLDLSRNPIENAGASALARSPHYPGLRELRLGSCGILNRGGIALASSTTLAGLISLDLSDNPLNDTTRAALRERFGERVIF